jgi:hypothetical protein
LLVYSQPLRKLVQQQTLKPIAPPPGDAQTVRRRKHERRSRRGVGKVHCTRTLKSRSRAARGSSAVTTAFRTAFIDCSPTPLLLPWLLLLLLLLPTAAPLPGAAAMASTADGSTPRSHSSLSATDSRVKPLPGHNTAHRLRQETPHAYAHAGTPRKSRTEVLANGMKQAGRMRRCHEFAVATTNFSQHRAVPQLLPHTQLGLRWVRDRRKLVRTEAGGRQKIWLTLKA